MAGILSRTGATATATARMLKPSQELLDDLCRLQAPLSLSIYIYTCVLYLFSEHTHSITGFSLNNLFIFISFFVLFLPHFLSSFHFFRYTALHCSSHASSFLSMSFFILHVLFPFFSHCFIIGTYPYTQSLSLSLSDGIFIGYSL